MRTLARLCHVAVGHDAGGVPDRRQPRRGDAHARSIPHGTQDVTKAIAGEYTLDPNHVGVIARVSHLGLFDERVPLRQGISEAFLGSGQHLALADLYHRGNRLDCDKRRELCRGSDRPGIPEVGAVSAGDVRFHRLPQADATHGKVDGTFTLMGKTVPVTFDVTLVGAGPGFAGGPVMGHVIGIHAVTHIDPQDFGMSAFFARSDRDRHRHRIRPQRLNMTLRLHFHPLASYC